MVLEILAGDREQLFEAWRRRNDGRPSVESEAILLVDVSSSPGLVSRLEESRLKALGLQSNGDRQTAETTPDNGRAPRDSSTPIARSRSRSQ